MLKLFTRLAAQAALMLLAVFVISACNKREEVVIPNNQPPPDSTINTVTKENYVNRLYISILGRKCTQAEFDESYNILIANELSVDSRKQVFDLIAAKPGYYERILKINETDLLNSSDSIDYANQMTLYNLLLQNPAYQSIWPFINYEKPRLQKMIDVLNDLKSGTANVVELHKRCVYNYIYDGINMGSLNFVAAMYQDFFYRYPSQSELDAGIKAVDGVPSTVFFQTASNKEEFMDLFFASDNYFEGQVRDLFSRYLFREPTSAEQTFFSERYKSNMDYKAFQRDILTLDEFVGI